MVEVKVLSGVGLCGQVVGQIVLFIVGQEGVGLIYCGYDVCDLVVVVIFEEVVYLLFYGELLNK